MKDAFRKFLFSRHILVSEAVAPRETCVETLVALAHFFGIEIAEGAALAQPEMIRLAQEMLGENVPEPFYRGFPDSVRELTTEQWLFDQMIHYLRTYDMGDFSRPGHSLLEGRPDMSGRELIAAVLDELNGTGGSPEALLRPAEIVRGDLEESGERRSFVIVTEEAARQRIRESVESFLSSTRPLSLSQLDVVAAYFEEHPGLPEVCACKDTAIALMLVTRDAQWCRFLKLSDAIDVADAMNQRLLEELGEWPEGSPGVRQLNLPNRDRKLLKQMIDEMFRRGGANTRDCFTRQALWCGLLHHIHYKPVNGAAEAFAREIRGGRNRSPESEFERTLAERGPAAAASALRASRGPGAVLRHLDYLLSRCRGPYGALDEEEISGVLGCVGTDNAIILIQLLIRYANDHSDVPRTFRFTKHHRLRVHTETDRELIRRRSALNEDVRERAFSVVSENLRLALAGRLGRVYIDPDMRRMAVPLRESASMGGIGVLPGGSRLPLEAGKVVRGFTYWEKVKDIDLSVIGIDRFGAQTEFSWRTMGREMGSMMKSGQKVDILYSGDQTSGYDGGSEYFDVDVAAFRETNPNLRYLVFCDNIYTDGVSFGECVCRAGYMLRESPGSGEVYEPKTVASAFPVAGRGRFAFLFAIDLEESEFIWLNILRDSDNAVAGETSLDFLKDTLTMTRVFSMYDLFTMMAGERVDDPARAEVIVTDKPVDAPEGAAVIRSWDYEKTLGWLNGRTA